MKVELIINARFLCQPLTGVQRFAGNICLELKRIFPEAIFLAPSNIKNVELARKLGVRIFGSLSSHLWEQLELPIFLKKSGEPVLVNLANTGPAFYKNQIIILHDITFIGFSDSYSRLFRCVYAFLIPRLLKNARAIGTVSEFARSEISLHYGIDGRFIEVVPNAADTDFIPSQGSRRAKPYLLAVSSPHPNKNFGCVLSAYKRWKYRGDFDLLVVGQLFNKDKAGDGEYLDGGVEYLGRVEDSYLIELYSGAFVFLHPSIYEGFGIPPLEAQACGCPVVASNASVNPEVLADSALYFNPNDPDSLNEVMSMLVEMPELRRKLINTGFINSKRFTWRSSAEKLASIIRRINN